MNSRIYQSWGGITAKNQRVLHLDSVRAFPASDPTGSSSYLVHGNGRSYGDVCLNEDGQLIDSVELNGITGFCRNSGSVSVLAGTRFNQIHDIVMPEGWFLPVTPGTEYVTIGGAIANDVHGKNHGSAGSFGCHVLKLTLLRSDGQLIQCSRQNNEELFLATIGGLGLTGIILDATIQLKRIESDLMVSDGDRFSDVDGFFDLSMQCPPDREYSVAWIDCAARGSSLGRGVFFRGRHASRSEAEFSGPVNQRRVLSFPFKPPVSIVNTLFVRAFNAVYFRAHRNVSNSATVGYKKFFYPLDSVRHWNRIYGRRGFFQFQSIVGMENARSATIELLDIASRYGGGSFLAVLKMMGNKGSGGLMSFSREGVTLALDIPNRGQASTDVLRQLESVCMKYGGAINPSKDANMSGDAFRIGYPNIEQFKQHIDPKFSSSFWRRVTED
ncbi:MAG: FAD-binding oxidoreductase [Pseudomonadota bacterium]